MHRKYLEHNFYVLIALVGSYFLYTLSTSFIAKNICVLLALFLFFLINVHYHYKHTKLHKEIVFEYLLISTLLYLIYLIIVLY